MCAPLFYDLIIYMVLSMATMFFEVKYVRSFLVLPFVANAISMFYDLIIYLVLSISSPMFFRQSMQIISCCYPSLLVIFLFQILFLVLTNFCKTIRCTGYAKSLVLLK